MTSNISSESTDEEVLKTLFQEAMNQFDEIEKSNEAHNSSSMQVKISTVILKFEKATNLVSLSEMFSKNESVEELSTDTLQYLLLPALLGTLTLKRCGAPRSEVINIADIYFRDFLQRCKDYGLTDVEVPEPISTDEEVIRVQTEQAKISSMVMTREAKIKQYKEGQELKKKLAMLSTAVSASHVDDEVKREYFLTLLQSYVNQALDEINSIEQEKPILEYMAKHAGEPRPKQKRPPALKPVIITKDEVQKAVFGAGYPSLPAMTVEEFYEQRVRDGTWPAASNIPTTTIQSTETAENEDENEHKENLEEADDPEELARKRAMDEYKDDHRRGWGNRHNRS